MPLLRRRRSNPGKASRTWRNNRPSWGTDDPTGRYMRTPEIERWGAVPFDMPPDPERNAIHQRVRQITESLEGAIDEGTGAALDRLIESWVAAWIATVEADYTDHCTVINVRHAQATQWLAESRIAAEHELEELVRVRAAYLACRSRLAGEQTTDTCRQGGSDTSGEPS